ncbi:5'-deoxyadenosine deaminase [Desulfitibacter alkalitolerans]|uniref:5'-deoxyadenosine deaminase n=1 Tax=Desulfitibacter alkalitolerans TaxID=264641 RepID=UPI00048461D2|nr:5'-deoxyadenosine deaminase [Desulfitibacter alkalitolerans]
MRILFKGPTIVTMDSQEAIIKGNVLVENNRIAYIGSNEPTADRVILAEGKLLIPGLIQTHVHLSQTLFRGQADDLELLDWLKKRIWPLEGAHDEESLYQSALLGISELLLGGTTTLVDMQTVHHTDAAIHAIAESGIRATTGKVMMDHGEEVPGTLIQSTNDAIQESVDLLEKWHGKENGRIQYAFTPRFVVSCTEDLLKEVVKLSSKYGVRVHTHASENKGEIEIVERERGMRNVLYLDHIGMAAPNLILTHCIWLNDQEMEILQKRDVKVAHCPTCNIKLASGIAPIPEMLKRGITVSLGADGAPCNNNLDIFQEMKMAALIQKPLHGPTVMPAREVFKLATLGGARAMGLENDIGSIEVGKKADLVLISLDEPHVNPVDGVDPYSLLVYSVRSSDVCLTMVDGKILMENRELKTIDKDAVVKKSNISRVRLDKLTK